MANSTVQDLCREIWGCRATAWRVGQYVLMPDHVHLFCSPETTEAGSLERWVTYWKALFARVHPQPPGTRCFQWHHWDTRMRDEDAYRAKRDYVWQNPVRAGLVSAPEDWPFRGEVFALEWN